jgi:gamma-glutamyltranspeptidase
LAGFLHRSMIPGSPEYQALLIDIQDIAFADRNKYMGDADYTDVPVCSFFSAFLSTSVIHML